MPAVLAGAVAFSAISSITGGMAGQSSANAQAKLQEQQGGIALEEAKANATNEAYNQNLLLGKQRLAFLANGVSLEGSPTLVQKATQQYGQQQVDSILKQGAAQYDLAQRNAAVTRNQGRGALIAGLGSGVGTTAQGIETGYKAGIFNKKGIS